MNIPDFLILIEHLGVALLIGWGFFKWIHLTREIEATRPWIYIDWSNAELIELHEKFCSMLLHNQKNAHCYREMEAIKKALAMRQKLKAE